MTAKKTSRKRNNNPTQTRRNWQRIIDGLNRERPKRIFTMGSPGSAQVTRDRLLKEYLGITIHTTGSKIVIELK